MDFYTLIEVIVAVVIAAVIIWIIVPVGAANIGARGFFDIELTFRRSIASDRAAYAPLPLAPFPIPIASPWQIAALNKPGR
jgi:hypothetical protein